MNFIMAVLVASLAIAGAEFDAQKEINAAECDVTKLRRIQAQAKEFKTDLIDSPVFIRWRSLETGYEGQGGPLKRIDAESWVTHLNKKYAGEITHLINERVLSDLDAQGEESRQALDNQTLKGSKK